MDKREINSLFMRIDRDYMEYLNDVTVEMVQNHEKPSAIHAVRKQYLEWQENYRRVYGED